MDSSTKNIVFSKAGATITCPVCQKIATYQIGQLDRNEWAKHRGKYWCKECRALPAHIPNFSSLGQTDTNDIDKLLEMI